MSTWHYHWNTKLAEVCDWLETGTTESWQDDPRQAESQPGFTGIIRKK